MGSEDLLQSDAALEHVASGATWSEGPLWMPERGVLRWSDIPGDRILETDALGSVRVAREHVEFTNGRVLARGGVVQCSHGRRAIELDRDGTVTTLVDRFGAHRLNSPNDIALHPDGSLWFTDPPYGIVQPHEGHPGEQEYGGCFVFRWSEADGIAPVVTDMCRPNGIAFSPDASVLYVTDTGRALDDGPEHDIRAYDVTGDGAATRATGGRVLARVDAGVPDGIAVDAAGRIWSSSGDGVHVFDERGRHVLHVPVPEVVGNVCFGDDGWLWIAASTSIYRIRTTTSAA